jgi:hypothetical protein
MRRPALFILAAGAFGVAACDSERAIGREPVGDPAYGIRFVIAGTNTPQGTAIFRVPPTTATGATDTVRITLRGLDSLAGQARYTLWVGDTGTLAEASFRRLTARVTMTRSDTVINAQGDPVEQVTTTTLPSTDNFSNGGPRTTFTITGGVPSGFATGRRPGTVLITIEDSPTATAPNPNRRPIWATRTRFTARGSALLADTSTIRFGNFHPRADSAYIYAIGPQRGRATFRGDVMVVNDSSLPRPPRGYFYATYLVKRDDSNQAIDTVYLGPQTSPAPRRDISLRDADSVVVDPLIQTTGASPQILAAAARASADTVGGLDVNVPFRGVADVLVTLELKGNKVDEARMGPAIVLRADVPTIVRNGPRVQ